MRIELPAELVNSCFALITKITQCKQQPGALLTSYHGLPGSGFQVSHDEFSYDHLKIIDAIWNSFI